MTAQPPGSRSSALRVATNGQQVASFGGSYLSAEVQSAYYIAPANRAARHRDIICYYDMLIMNIGEKFGKKQKANKTKIKLKIKMK